VCHVPGALPRSVGAVEAGEFRPGEGPVELAARGDGGPAQATDRQLLRRLGQLRIKAGELVASPDTLDAGRLEQIGVLGHRRLDGVRRARRAQQPIGELRMPRLPDAVRKRQPPRLTQHRRPALPLADAVHEHHDRHPKAPPPTPRRPDATSDPTETVPLPRASQ